MKLGTHEARNKSAEKAEPSETQRHTYDGTPATARDIRTYDGKTEVRSQKLRLGGQTNNEHKI